MGIAMIDGIINPGIARIVCVQPGDLYQGEVLIKYAMKSTSIFGRGTYEEIEQKIKEQFPNCRIVRNQEYLCELDHINLFGVKSDAQDWTAREENVSEN